MKKTKRANESSNRMRLWKPGDLAEVRMTEAGPRACGIVLDVKWQRGVKLMYQVVLVLRAGTQRWFPDYELKLMDTES